MSQARVPTLPVTLLGALLLMPGIASQADGTHVNVVASRIKSIQTDEYSTQARLLVIALDHEGRGLEGIPVSVISRNGSAVATGTTKADGRVLLDVAVLGRVTVRAAHVGFVTAEARDVELRKSSFAAVALPLEVAEVTDPLTSR